MQSLRRSRVVRQLTAAVVLVVMFAGVGTLVWWRGQSERFTSTATVHLGSSNSDPRNLALAPSTRAAALQASGLMPGTPHVTFAATATSSTDLALTVTAPSSIEASRLIRNWASAFVAARRDADQKSIAVTRDAISKQVATLHNELRRVDRELTRLDPSYVPPGCTRYGMNQCAQGMGAIPDGGSLAELNLIQERMHLLNEVTVLANESARLRGTRNAVVVRPAAAAPPRGFDETTPSTETALAIAATGLLAGAFVIYRFRTRPRASA